MAGPRKSTHGRGGHARLYALARHVLGVPTGAASQQPPPLSIDFALVAHALDGSDQDTLAKMRVLAQIENDAAWSDDGGGASGGSSAGAPSAGVRLLRRLRRLFEYFGQDGTSGRQRAARLAVLPLVDPALHMAVMAHFGQFVGALQALGSQSDRAELVPPALAGKMLGCFACAEADPTSPWAAAAAGAEQPPLATAWGFGAAGVHASASWLPDSDELLLETPPSAAKWGVAGLSCATHAVVIARLWLPAQPGTAEPLADCGLQAFIVQIRQPESGALLPGISTGDCPTLEAAAPAASLCWLRLSGVRVARSAMLGRFGEVRKGGVWVCRDPVPVSDIAEAAAAAAVDDGAAAPETTPAEQADTPPGEDAGSAAASGSEAEVAEPELEAVTEAVEAEAVFGSSPFQTDARCALLREAGEAQAALLYRAAAAGTAPAQVLQPLAACYATRLISAVATDVVTAMATALNMIESSLPPVGSLQPPKPPPPPPPPAEEKKKEETEKEETEKADGEGAAASAPDSPATDDAAPSEPAEEPAIDPSTLTEERVAVAKAAMEKAGMKAAEAEVKAEAESSAAAPPASNNSSSSSSEQEEEKPDKYALVDLSLVAEVTTTVAALQHQLCAAAGGAIGGGAWLWDALSGQPQLMAHAALRMAMIPAGPDPLECMGTMLCDTYAAAQASRPLLVEKGGLSFRVVPGVLSRPASVVVAADSDDGELLSSEYLEVSFASDGLVPLPAELTGCAGATDWQLTVLVRLAQAATAAAGSMPAMCAAAQAHVTLCAARCFARAVLRMADSPEKGLMRALCDVYCLTCIRDASLPRLAAILASHVLPEDALPALDSALALLEAELAPHAEGLAGAATFMSSSTGSLATGFAAEVKPAGEAGGALWRDGVLPLIGTK